MEPDHEFKEFAELFQSHGVRFMIIGGYAVTAHGHPRYTGDIDFFVEKSEAYPRHVMFPLGGLEVPFIGLEDLKQNKRSTGRHKDLGDLDALEQLSD